MRLWHYKLISCLPTAQLLRQWRECCDIASRWATEGTPRHALVNKVMQYPVSDFIIFCKLVYDEMVYREYFPQEYTVAKLKDNFVMINDCSPTEELREYIDIVWNYGEKLPYSEDVIIFEGWHNNKYLEQCYYNLEEKHDCGCIPEKEWQRFLEGGKELV